VNLRGIGALLYPASQDGSPIKGFLGVIRGELSSGRICLRTSRPAGQLSQPLSRIRDGKVPEERRYSVTTVPERHAEQRRRSLGGHQAALPRQRRPI